MTSTLRSLDGAGGDVFDSGGQVVARIVLADQRVQAHSKSRIEGEVLGAFEQADPGWAQQLPRGFGGTRNPVIVAIVLDSGERFDDVQVAMPWVDGPGGYDTFFPLHHSEF
jgi:hypothetical protein